MSEGEPDPRITPAERAIVPECSAIRCLLKNKKPETLEVDLTDDLGTKGGDVCGGKMLVFIEPFLATG